MKSDKVTVVTVTYNAEDLLEETILSVINQDYNNLEYIIIDGASTDGTLDIIKKYEDKINYWTSEPDEGIYFAMNKAIEKATGEWINFMNAGDTFFDDKTISYLINHKNMDAELIYGNCQIGTYSKKPHTISGYDDTTSICHQTLFVKSKLMKETPFDTKYKISADHNFILKMFKHNRVFQYVDRNIASYLLNGFSGTEKLRLYIEGLSVLFENNVSNNNILTSPWYQDMKKYICKTNETHINVLKKELLDKEKIIQSQEDQYRRLSALKEAVKQITHYSIWKNPIKKYKAYKTMLKTYHKITKGEK